MGGTLGGATDTADLGSLGSLSLQPRFGATGTVRAGYVLAPAAMVYAVTGYGGNAYRVRDTAPSRAAVICAGAAASSSVSVRSSG